MIIFRFKASNVLIDLGWNAPTKIKLICKLTFSLTTNLQHILMQKLLKSMINCVKTWKIYSTFKTILATVKAVLNPNFQPFGFELNKK